MTLRKILLIFGFCLLSACATEKELNNDTPQAQPTQYKGPTVEDTGKSLRNRHEKSADLWVVKLTPITDSIAKDCRQKKDRDYIACLNSKDDALIASSFFPDLAAKMINARKELDQKLLKKKMSRKDFLEKAAKLQENLRNEVNDRVERDIKAGVYTGKY